MQLLLVAIAFLVTASTGFPIEEDLFKSSETLKIVERALKDQDLSNYGFDLNTLSDDIKEDAFLTTVSGFFFVFALNNTSHKC